jgi:hypothetical protein
VLKKSGAKEKEEGKEEQRKALMHKAGTRRCDAFDDATQALDEQCNQITRRIPSPLHATLSNTLQTPQ